MPEVCTTVIRLTGKEAKDVNVLYLGTATYDLPGPLYNQTFQLEKAGCTVSSLKVTSTVPDDMSASVEKADIIVISGGNSLFAVDRWNKIGLAPMLRTAMDRGAVLTGGSAGAICWFDGGHSDSWDPDTFKKAMLADKEERKDEASSAPKDGQAKKDWKYIRVPFLGFLPGLCVPHHDKV